MWLLTFWFLYKYTISINWTRITIYIRHTSQLFLIFLNSLLKKLSSLSVSCKAFISSILFSSTIFESFFTVITYSLVVVPSSDVTLTIILLSPSDSLSLPVISIFTFSFSPNASIFKVSTLFPTVPQSYSKISLENSGDNVAFSTIKFCKYEFDLFASPVLVTVIVYTFLVPSCAVTVIYTLLSPFFKPVLPDIATFDFESSATAVTFKSFTFSPTVTA